MVTVRPATPSDGDAILAVVGAAFGGGGRDPSEEIEIVTATWARATIAFELVAVDDEQVVGHVLAAEGDLAEAHVVGIAPLAVAPERQRTGIGTALMTTLLGAAEEAGLPLVVLLGNPAYYTRFGFEPASAIGITYPPAGEGNPAFQVRRLSRDDGSLRGTFRYHWER
jgi:putative acetyltransferase